MSGKGIPGGRWSIGGGEMQEMKAPVRGTPGVLHKCNIKRCNGGLRPYQGGKRVTLIDR